MTILNETINTHKDNFDNEIARFERSIATITESQSRFTSEIIPLLKKLDLTGAEVDYYGIQYNFSTLKEARTFRNSLKLGKWDKSANVDWNDNGYTEWAWKKWTSLKVRAMELESTCKVTTQTPLSYKTVECNFKAK